MIKVGIIDYGVGNTNSLNKSLKSIGYRSIKTYELSILEDCDVIVLPGVGSFPYAMEKLIRSKLAQFIIDQSICLGMQLLTERSAENGEHNGLEIIPGEIKKNLNSNHHIGWNNIEVQKEVSFIKKFNNHEFFFNHGYSFVGPKKYVVSKTYFGESFASVIMKEKTIGFQFHPEKSQKAGLQLLKSAIKFLLVKNA